MKNGHYRFRLTTSDAARALSVTPTRIRQLAARGRIAFEWTPLGRLIDPVSVEAYRVDRDRRRTPARTAS